MANSITHFSHPAHKLVKTRIPSGQYTCDLCCTTGSDFSYRCNACNFDLHEQCAALPETMSSFAHPWHDLHLQSGTNSRICDLCMQPVKGFYYRCIPCGVDVHPHCTMRQQIVYTELHPEHSLCLVPALGICTACKEFDGIWLYRCGICNVNLHMRCLHGAIMHKEHNHGNVTRSIENKTSSHAHGRLSLFLSKIGQEVAVDSVDLLIESVKQVFLPGN